MTSVGTQSEETPTEGCGPHSSSPAVPSARKHVALGGDHGSAAVKVHADHTARQLPQVCLHRGSQNKGRRSNGQQIRAHQMRSRLCSRQCGGSPARRPPGSAPAAPQTVVTMAFCALITCQSAAGCVGLVVVDGGPETQTIQSQPEQLQYAVGTSRPKETGVCSTRRLVRRLSPMGILMVQRSQHTLHPCMRPSVAASASVAVRVTVSGRSQQCA